MAKKACEEKTRAEKDCVVGRQEKNGLRRTRYGKQQEQHTDKPHWGGNDV